jgi:hypothetical protein
VAIMRKTACRLFELHWEFSAYFPDQEFHLSDCLTHILWLL